MAHIVTEACIGTKDKACISACPVHCIREGEQQVYINPARCIDCGACIAVCPTSAIFPEPQVPAEWASFVVDNRAFFEPK